MTHHSETPTDDELVGAMSAVEKLQELWRFRWNLIGTPAIAAGGLR